MLASYVTGPVDLESVDDLLKVIELPSMQRDQFGQHMSVQAFDGAVLGLTLGTAALRHANSDWHQENTAGRVKSQVFQKTVCDLFGAFQESVHYPNLLKALNFDFLDDLGKVVAIPGWLECNQMDGQGIYLSETLQGQLKPCDRLSKALTPASAAVALGQEEK